MGKWNNVYRWLRRNQEHISRIQGLSKLEPKSSQKLFDAWKEAVSLLKKRDTRVNKKQRKQARDKHATNFKSLKQAIQADDDAEPIDLTPIDKKTTSLLNGSVNKTVYTYTPTVIDESSASDIVTEITDRINREIRANARNEGDIKPSRTICKIIFYTQDPNNTDNPTIGSKLISNVGNEVLTYEDVFQKIKELLSIHHNSKDYSCFLFKLEVWTTFSKRKEKKGGCAEDKDARESVTFRKGDHIITSTNSKMNNCAFMCFNLFFGVKVTQMRPNEIRKDMGIDQGVEIPIHDLPKILAYYNKKIYDSHEENYRHMIVYDENLTVMLEYSTIPPYKMTEEEVDRVVRISHAGNHYYAIDVKDQKPNFKLFQSMPSPWRRELEKQVDQNTNSGPLLYIAPLIETAMPTQIVYWSGLELLFTSKNNKNTTPSKFVDQTKLLETLFELENTTIVTYNGAQNDFYQLAAYIRSRGVNILNKDILTNDGNILRLSFGNGNQVFSLIKFTVCAEVQAMKDFEIENNDPSVMLCDLFNKVHKMIFELTGLNITSYITIYQIAYTYWGNISLPAEIQIEGPTNEEKIAIIRSATYGGRCEAKMTNFVSKQYDQIVKGEVTYNDLLESKDCRRYTDVSSLYPASMAKYKYPIGSSYFSRDPEFDYSNGRIGIYDISFIAPENIGTYTLPSRNEKREVAYVRDGRGYYTSVDITLAKSLGYQITFIGKAIVWMEQSDEVFSSYVTQFYKVKNDSISNPTKRSIAKLLLNSLYGNLSRVNKDKKVKICTTGIELEKFLFEDIDEIEEIEQIGECVMVTGVSKPKESEKTQSWRRARPCQLSAFVLSYSRKIMVDNMTSYDTDLTNPFSYTDTDSLRVSQSQYEILEIHGRICDKKNATLGTLVDELSGGLIIHEQNSGAKRYTFDYIMPNGEIKTVNKIAGVPSAYQRKELLDGQSHTITYPSVKRDVTTFSIQSVERTYTIRN